MHQCLVGLRRLGAGREARGRDEGEQRHQASAAGYAEDTPWGARMYRRYHVRGSPFLSSFSSRQRHGAKCTQDPLKMTTQDRPGSRGAHDVLRVSNDLHHQVAIGATEHILSASIRAHRGEMRKIGSTLEPALVKGHTTPVYP